MKALIFDLDGTLLNTLADIANACNYALNSIGLPIHPVSAYARMIGNGFAMLLKRAVGEICMNQDELEKLISLARDWYAEHMEIETRPYPGMEKTLQTLAEAGVALGVLSNKPDMMTTRLIPHYFPQIPFLAIQGGRDDVPLKPNPQSLLQIMAQARIDKKDCFYIGDSNVDMETARNAGCHAIGVAWGFRGPEELKESGAEKILLEPSELLMLRD